MAEPDELLTVAEIAAELKMNQQTIRNGSTAATSRRSASGDG
jgi:hypothetical protein